MITRSIVKKICLSLIGGSPLTPVPTTKILGAPAMTQVGASKLSSFVSAATEIASAVGTLSSIVQNPVGSILSEMDTNIGNLTKDNFASLDTTLSSIASSVDPGVQTAYGNLKKALGGGDGVSGIYSQIKKFKEHTDRISGVTVSADSDLSKPLTNEQTPGGR